MQIPATIEEITPAWLSYILKQPISSENFQLTPNVQEGTGFLSNLVRVSCQPEPGNNPNPTVTAKPIQLVVKLPPENFMLEYLISSKMDESEILCYKEILPRLVAQSPELGLDRNFCRFIYGEVCSSPDSIHRSVLVLEDLKPLGYRTIDFHQDLTLTQLEEAVRFLAKFHAAGRALEASIGKPLPEAFSNLRPKTSTNLKELLAQGFEGVEKFLEGLEDPLAGKLLPVFQKLTPLAGQIFDLVVEAEKEYPCMIHTDLWPNNLLFCDGDGPDGAVGGTRPVKVIDWQIASYNDPTFDLSVLLLSGLPALELSKENVERMLRLYYQEHEAAVAGNSNLKFEGSRDARNFEKTAEYFYGMAMAWALVFLIYSADAFSANPPRLLAMLDFLEREANVFDFLIEAVAITVGKKNGGKV